MRIRKVTIKIFVQADRGANCQSSAFEEKYSANVDLSASQLVKVLTWRCDGDQLL